MSAFDLSKVQKSIAPDLTNNERLKYLVTEQEFVEELLEDAEDSKWVYQALIECVLLKIKLTGSASTEEKTHIKMWLGKLKELDPLRSGRWNDTEKTLFETSSSPAAS